jgi:hypothetical protein
MEGPDKEPEIEIQPEVEVDEFKDAKQLKMEGFKPKAIEELETDFETYLKTKKAKTAIDEKLKDSKAKLGATMKKHKQPAYGYKSGKETYVATLVNKDDVTVKTASTADRGGG